MYDLVSDLFKDLSFNSEFDRVKRLGKPGPRPRPLLIELKSLDEMLNLLWLKHKLRSIDRWKNIWVNQDLTVMQRTHLAGLRVELKKKQSNGEHGWTIKHVNGSPRLIQNN